VKNHRRQLNRTGYAQHFITLRLPLDEANTRRRNIQKGSDQANNRLVRLAVGGRRRRPHQQTAVTDFEHFVAACAWLHADRKGEFIADPPHAGFPGRHGRARYRSPMNSLTSAPSAINANIGERSKPPIGGMMRRNGRSNGSVSEYTIATAGL